MPGPEDIFSFGTGIAGTVSQTIQSVLANLANTFFLQQSLDKAGQLGDRQLFGTDLYPGAVPIMERGRQDYLGINPQGEKVGKSLSERFGEGMAPITDSYEARRNRILGMLEGSEKQSVKDITRDYANLESGQQQDLTNAGLTGTTILPSMRAGVRRERAESIGREKERFRQQRVSTDIGLSGDALAARERQHIGTYGAFLDSLRADIGLSQLPMQVDAQNTARELALLSGVDIQGPDPGAFNQWMQGLGASTVQPPSPPSTSPDILGPAATTAGSVGSAFTVATIVSTTFVCLDIENTMLETPYGKVRMRDVHDGDYILNGDRRYVKVLFIDKCLPHPEKWYVEITVEDADGARGSLRAMDDHIVEGKPAGEWRPGEKCGRRTVLGVDPVPAFLASDVLMEGDCKTYFANGFLVESGAMASGDTAEAARNRRARHYTHGAVAVKG